MRFSELIPILQASVSPVIMISGVGLLILSMTNRFGRVIDRSREIDDALGGAARPGQDHLKPQLAILYRRARLLRAAITSAIVSVLAAAVLMVALFLASLLNVEVVLIIAGLFIVCLVSLIISLLAFLMDINLSLAALKVELGPRL
jgi:Protein of unknown function (DUF2721)